MLVEVFYLFMFLSHLFSINTFYHLHCLVFSEGELPNRVG